MRLFDLHRLKVTLVELYTSTSSILDRSTDYLGSWGLKILDLHTTTINVIITSFCLQRHVFVFVGGEQLQITSL